MQRSTLRTLLRNLAAASVTLAAACNEGGLPGSDPDRSDGANPDLALCAPPVVTDMARPPPPDAYYSCGTPTYYVLVDGADLGTPYPYGEVCQGPCGRPVDTCPIVEQGCGKMVLLCIPGVCSGRRPEGLRSPAEGPAGGEPARQDPAGAHWARVAHLEAASVTAFRVLAAELRAHRAPEALARRAEAAALDEVRHARMMAALARRAGARVAPVVIEPQPVRPLAEVARENAVEGCVRETFGALLASVQAQLADEARVRRTLARLASDEIRHAELGWAVQRWAEPRLPQAERRRAEEARSAAFAEIVAGASLPVPLTLRRRLGLPAPAVTRQLAQALARHLNGVHAIPRAA